MYFLLHPHQSGFVCFMYRKSRLPLFAQCKLPPSQTDLYSLWSRILTYFQAAPSWSANTEKNGCRLAVRCWDTTLLSLLGGSMYWFATTRRHSCNCTTAGARTVRTFHLLLKLSLLPPLIFDFYHHFVCLFALTALVFVTRLLLDSFKRRILRVILWNTRFIHLLRLMHSLILRLTEEFIFTMYTRC